MATYTYSVTTDFGGTSPLLPQLQQDIIDSSIAKTVIGITMTGDDVDITFNSSLTGGEQDTLNTVVSNYILDNTFGKDPKGTITISDGIGGTTTLEPGNDDDYMIVDSSTSQGVKYVAPLPSNYIDGLTLNRNSVSVVRVDVGTSRDTTNNANITLDSNIIVNITTSGAAGLDTGSETSSTWYAIHVIGDSSGVNAGSAIFSISETTPTLPSGYDVFRRIGWVYNDSGSNFLDWDQIGTGRTRRIHYDETFATVRVLNSGSATTMTDVDCSGLSPPTTRYLTILVEFSTGTLGSSSDFARIRAKGSDSVGPIKLSTGTISGSISTWLIKIPCNNNQVVQYLVNNGTYNSLSLGIVDFEDNI